MPLMMPPGLLRPAAGGGGGLATMLLDLSGHGSAKTAIGLCKLRTAYAGSCIRVRTTAAGNAQTDIGFGADGYVDTAALASAASGGNSLDIVTWYDQSGNALDFTVAVANEWCRIVSAGTLNTQNGKPVAIPNSFSAGYKSAAWAASHTGTTLSCLFVGAHGANTDERAVSCTLNDSAADSTGTDQVAMIKKVGSTSFWGGLRNSTALATIASGGAGTIKCLASRFTGTNQTMDDGTLTDSVATTGAFLVQKTLLFAQTGTAGNTATGARFQVQVVWASNVGTGLTTAGIPNQKTWWGL